jgi:hypothetical protein
VDIPRFVVDGCHLRNIYPVNYEKTIEHARKQTEYSRAVEHLDEIEERWSRITTCAEYSYYDIRKDILLTDIKILIRCCVMFLNRIAAMEDLVKHKKPKKGGRAPRVIRLPGDE